MRNISLIIIATAFLISCSSDTKSISRSCDSGFCINKMSLLNHLNLEKRTQLDFYKIRDSTRSKFERTFETPFCNLLIFSLNYKVCESIEMPIVVNCYYNSKCSQLTYQPRDVCYILLSNEGKVLFNGFECDIDSIINNIITVIKKKPDNLDIQNIFFSFLWDKDVDEYYFRKVVNQIIRGYLILAEAKSIEYFHKPVCLLNSKEIIALNYMLPFNLYIESMGEFEMTTLLHPN